MNRLVVTDIRARGTMLSRFSVLVRVGPARRRTQQLNILATRTCFCVQVFPSQGKTRACFFFLHKKHSTDPGFRFVNAKQAGKE